MYWRTSSWVNWDGMLGDVLGLRNQLSGHKGEMGDEGGQEKRASHYCGIFIFLPRTQFLICLKCEISGRQKIPISPCFHTGMDPKMLEDLLSSSKGSFFRQKLESHVAATTNPIREICQAYAHIKDPMSTLKLVEVGHIHRKPSPGLCRSSSLWPSSFGASLCWKFFFTFYLFVSVLSENFKLN